MKRLRMASKLALAIVPIGLVALAAGALVARLALDRAFEEERASLAAAVAADAMDALVAFSEEHSLALDIAVGNSEGDLSRRQSTTDNALERLAESVRVLTPRAAGPASGIVARMAGDSSRVRGLVTQLRNADPTSPDSADVVADIGERLITMATQSTFYLGDVSAAREGEGAVALSRASFASFQEELAIIQNEFAPPLDDEEFAQQMLVLESTVEEWIDTAAASSPTVDAQGVSRTQTLRPDQGFTSETYPMDRNIVLADAAGEILVRVSNTASAAAKEARNQAQTVGLIVIVALVLAAVVALIVSRSTTRRVKSITAAAHHVAEVDLPKMVDSLRNPSGVLEATTPIEVDKSGKDEIGDLARSFSTLHTTLVDVANQQMDSLRKGVSDIFVTLAHRNRSLVDRQLALVDELESREEDPEALEGYYKLDHLATRMRRNAESLLVLAGSESPRMWVEPVEMGEVVRAALGEVDEYKRVEVLAMEPSLLVGRAVSDLSHLLSELLDNATQFSPPTERVRVTGLFDDDGYVITVADSGVGMSDQRMAELNHLIESPPVLGLALEPTLGMYVVARLALRHGIKAKLVPGVPGTTVRVTIPRQLLETPRPTILPESTAPETVVEPAPEPRPVAVAPESNGHASERVPTPTEAPAAPKPSSPAPAPAKAEGKPSEAPAPSEVMRRRPAPSFAERIDEVMKEPAVETPAAKTPAPVAEPAVVKEPVEAREPVLAKETTTPVSPRHAAEPPSLIRKAGPPQTQTPSGETSLPTRQPGTSFVEPTELAVSSTSSRSEPAAIRSALDGYRQGRDIATRRSEDTTTKDEREAEGES